MGLMIVLACVAALLCGVFAAVAGTGDARPPNPHDGGPW